jgi:hypothetical protein
MSEFDKHMNGIKKLYYQAATAASDPAPQPRPEVGFQAFSKIPRLNRDIVITEKIDGTNAQILIRDLMDGEVTTDEPLKVVESESVEDGSVKKLAIWAGQRTKFCTPAKDNFGFGRWVETNAAELIELLGPGRHFGEWWGQKVQRTYGLTEKRFSLFNVSRYGRQEKVEDERCVKRGAHAMSKGRKMCQCHDFREALAAEVGGVKIAPVPTLYEGPWFVPGMAGDDMQVVHPGAGQYAPAYALYLLRTNGSIAAPGFEDPEGIVVFHTASGHIYKATCKNDEKPKGQQ